MNKTHLRTYANHIRSALVNRRDALKLELAVMFAVTLESEGNKRLAREAIYQVYNSTGSYQCSQPTDRDWKSVGRQISAGLALYDFIGAEEVAAWANGYKHGELIGALVEHIAPLKLSTVNEVLTVCEKVRKPHTRIGGQSVPEGAHVVQTEHVKFFIPPTVRADEVMTIINNLMQYANSLLDHNKQAEQKAA
jgi:hypothetical protein